MQGHRTFLLLAAILPVLGSGAALAQAHRPWTDPPGAAEPAQDIDPGATSGSVSPMTAPHPPAASGATGPEERNQRVETIRPRQPAPEKSRPSVAESQAPEQAARDFVTSYFEAWSSPNPETLRAMPGFYGTRAVFHGRSMSLSALMAEKRRFVRRWPDRNYRLRPDTLKVACEPSGRSCTVRALFAFDADSPSRAKRSKGTGMVEFVVDLSGDRPIIVSENSIVQDRQAARARRESESDQRSIE